MNRIIPFALTVLLPLAALAEEIEEHGAPHIPVAKLIFSGINFAIFLFIIVKLARNAELPQFFASRRLRIAEALDQADRAKREAEALRAEWQRRLDSLGTELEGMLRQARQDIAVERDQILAAARKAAEAIRRDAQRTADSELRAAQDALRGDVAKHALAIAERLAAQRLTATDQQRFVSEFVEQVAAQ
jgi:F-type H+-transporting ATPase subunit b